MLYFFWLCSLFSSSSPLLLLLLLFFCSSLYVCSASSACLGDAVQACAAAVQTVLRWHTSALNQLPAAVKQRRQAEHKVSTQGKALDRGSGGDPLVLPVTVLEVVLHTQHLQVTNPWPAWSSEVALVKQTSEKTKSSNIAAETGVPAHTDDRLWW